jgi:hypothetical protein
MARDWLLLVATVALIAIVLVILAVQRRSKEGAKPKRSVADGPNQSAGISIAPSYPQGRQRASDDRSGAAVPVGGVYPGVNEPGWPGVYGSTVVPFDEKPASDGGSGDRGDDTPAGGRDSGAGSEPTSYPSSGYDSTPTPSGDTGGSPSYDGGSPSSSD